MGTAYALRERDTDRVVREIVSEVRGVDADRVKLDSRLMEELGDDSLDLLHFVFRLERAFGIKVGEVSRVGLEKMLHADPELTIRRFVRRLVDE